MSMELRNLIDKEELIKDAMKLQTYRSNSKMIRLIDSVREEIINKLNENDDDYVEMVTILYKFANELKDRLRQEE